MLFRSVSQSRYRPHIAIGVLFALLSMLLFFPEYALERANTLTLKSLGEMDKLMKTIKGEHDLEKIRQHTQTVEMTLLQDITNFNKTIDDAKHELKARKHPELIEKYSQSLLQIRRLYRLLMFIFNYEINQTHIYNQKLHLIITQISTIIDTFYVPKNELAQIDLAQYEKLEHLVKGFCHFFCRYSVYADIYGHSAHVIAILCPAHVS